MTILIAGGSGLVGMRLSEILTTAGYTVTHLSRTPKANAVYKTYSWNPSLGQIDSGAVLEADYIVNLAGEGIVDKRWTNSRMRSLTESRTQSALTIAGALGSVAHRVKAYMGASAIGIYGDRGDAVLSEDSPTEGDGFMIGCCEAWEEAHRKIELLGVRTCIFRIGIVLSTRGGALREMMFPFNFRVGAYFGNGKQWYSWIHIDDLCHIFVKGIEDDSLHGIYNAVAPCPVSNYQMTLDIASAINKYAVMIPAPRFVLRIVMGEMSDVVFNSNRVCADKIVGAGFKFAFGKSIFALKDVIGRGI
jgi:uncharacterized protein